MALDAKIWTSGWFDPFVTFDFLSKHRQLGEGRPFYIELRRPQSLLRTSLPLLQSKINQTCAGQISVQELCLLKPSAVERIKECESTKRKSYLCQISHPTASNTLILNAFKPSTQVLEQQTPDRVLTSRSDLLRTRSVDLKSLTVINDKLFLKLDADVIFQFLL